MKTKFMRFCTTLKVAGGMLFCFIAANSGAADTASRVRALVAQRCSACHAVDGNSLVSAYPNLAGQNADYLMQQLKMFRGENGKPPLRRNPMMEPMVLDLSEADMQALANYYSRQPPANSGTRSAAAPASGQKIYTRGSDAGAPACIACHGAAGEGVPGAFPRLAGQHQAYVETQLRNYKEGRRGGRGKPMTLIGPLLSNAEIAAVSAYIGTLKTP